MRFYRRTLAWLIPLFAATALGLTACGGGGSIDQPEPLTDLSNPAYSMRVLWHTSTGNGAGKFIHGFQPVVADGRVYVANEGGKVVALSLDDGKHVWEQDTDKHLVSGPSLVDGSLLVGTRNGELLALSAEDGSKQWSADLPSEVVAPVAGADGIVVTRTVDGHVAALDLSNGESVWTIEGTNMPKLTIHGTPSPVIRGDTVYVGLDSGRILALDLETGEQRWSQTVAQPAGSSELDRIVDIDTDPLIKDGMIYAASAGETLAALSIHGGQIQWKKPFSSVKDLAADDHNIYGIDMDGVVVAASQANGGLLWIQGGLKHRKLSAPAVVDGHILVGDYEGYLNCLSPEGGTIVGRGRPFSEGIRAQPVVVGDRAIVLGVDGDVAMVKFSPRDQ